MNMHRNTSMLLSVSLLWLISHCVQSVTVRDKDSLDTLKDLDSKALLYLYQVGDFSNLILVYLVLAYKVKKGKSGLDVVAKY